MNKLKQLEDIIYDYDDLLWNWICGVQVNSYERDDGKTVGEVADELKVKAFELIGELRDEKVLQESIDSWAD